MAHSQAQVDQTVPWQFSTSGEFMQWLWNTRDFEALVISESGSWSWQVTTKDGTRLAQGFGTDFDTCEDQTLESIGKAYPSEAGYGRWTDKAARKYTLATGVRVDLAAGEGSMVRLFLTDDTYLDGRLQLGDWWFHLETTDENGHVSVWDVDPSKVKSVGALRWS